MNLQKIDFKAPTGAFLMTLNVRLWDADLIQCLRLHDDFDTLLIIPYCFKVITD